MNGLTNNIQNNALAALTSRAPQHVVGAIKEASVKTGVNFAYLVQQAQAESSFDPSAKAKTSSATGLYQFIEKTWMSMVESHGNQFGLDTDGKSRAQILEMRKDPEAASMMAAAFAGENEKFLNARWGGEVGSTELYFAHFLGAPKAAAFLKAKDDNPMQEAAILFPRAAKANKNVFYDTSTGRAKTMDEVYAFFDKKFSVKDDGIAIGSVDIASQDSGNSPLSNSVIAVHDIQNNLAPKNNKVENFHHTLYKAPARDFVFSSFQNLVADPLELILMSQMDVPTARRNDLTSLQKQRFELSSAQSFIKN